MIWGTAMDWKLRLPEATDDHPGPAPSPAGAAASRSPRSSGRGLGGAGSAAWGRPGSLHGATVDFGGLGKDNPPTL